jgi:hypothetical protein
MIAPFLAAWEQTMSARITFQLADHGSLLFQRLAEAHALAAIAL